VHPAGQTESATKLQAALAPPERAALTLPPGVAAATSAAALLPEVVGRKLTTATQLAPPARVPEHVVLSRWNSEALVPVMVTLTPVVFPAAEPPSFRRVKVTPTPVLPAVTASKV
jgi:hypothetical protein